MLPGRSIGISMASGKVQSRSDMGRENAADGGADTVALGSGDADRGVRTLRADAERGRAAQLPGGVAGRRRTARSRNRVAGSPRAGSSPHGLASIPSRRELKQLAFVVGPHNPLSLTSAPAEMARLIQHEPFLHIPAPGRLPMVVGPRAQRSSEGRTVLPRVPMSV